MGVIGGIAGYFTHGGLENRDARVRKETLFNLEKFGVSGLGAASESQSGGHTLIFTDDLDWLKKTKKEK